MSSNLATAAIRRLVAARAKGYCEYCHCSERFATESFTIEHIQPRSKPLVRSPRMRAKIVG